MNKTHGFRFKVLSKAREVESEVGGNDGVSRLEDNGLRNKMKVSKGGKGKGAKNIFGVKETKNEPSTSISPQSVSTKTFTPFVPKTSNGEIKQKPVKGKVDVSSLSSVAQVDSEEVLNNNVK